MPNNILPDRVRRTLADAGLPFAIVDCDPTLADTAVFCEKYGYSLADSANCIIITGKGGGEKRYVACVLLATTRLDVNQTVRKRLQVRRISFASAEETMAMTGMVLGGVTPIGLPQDLPLWVDAQVMQRPSIILGGGSRDCKIVISPTFFKQTPNTEIIENLANPIVQ